ncbi:hypothetical protein [uncultured Fibrobacter sp.]|uniref:hypothetical protein n=1 Tax=uncultured Fibrobacter sp. TaxID=261512 RepID=UPI0025EE2C3A|nr:hypothetical protein [uncultured Fibrobacter sp.]
MIFPENTLGIARRLVALSATALCLCILGACSVNLSQSGGATLIGDRPEHPFYNEIALHFDGKVQPLSTELQKAYSSAISEQAFPSGKCYGTADIYVAVTPSDTAEGNTWYIGAAFIPLWPALPVNEDWTFTFTTQIYCDSTLVHSLEFIESEHIEAFWYGALRSDLVNDAAAEMHRKLVERLAFEFHEQRQTDLNSASDY